MADTQHLQSAEAIEKIKELGKAARTCMFISSLAEVPLNSRPMSVQEIEDDGSIWFFSDKNSPKNSEIEADNRVQLFFANNANSEFLSVYGIAEISTDQNKIDELWSKWVKAWFPEGKEDPAVSLIKIKPESGYYWDTKHGKMVSLIKIAAAVVSGKTMDDGVEGELDV